MSESTAVLVRRLESKELPILERSFPSPFHRGRLKIQTEEDADYLIAWSDQNAVGHLLLRWQGAANEFLRQRVTNVPYVEAVAVTEALRSRGIGRQLMTTAEEMIRGRQLPLVGLAVGVKNFDALAFCAHLGYQLSSLEEFDVSWSYVDHDGAANVEDERCIYLVKNLE